MCCPIWLTQLEETARPQPSRRHELHLFQDRPAEYTVGIGERLEYFPVGLCHGNANEPALRAKLAKRHAAATAPCHCAVASARKIRSVDREMRWRCRLKVLWTAACMLRKRWADRADLKRCCLRSRRRTAGCEFS